LLLLSLWTKPPEKLGVSRRWFSDFLRSAPRCWLEAGNRKLFDEIAISTLREAMRCRPGALREWKTASNRSAFVGRAPGSVLAEAVEVQVYLLGSRYCETDRLSNIAWSIFGRNKLNLWQEAFASSFEFIVHEIKNWEARIGRSDDLLISSCI
jgi:hypothetical protein